MKPLAVLFIIASIGLASCSGERKPTSIEEGFLQYNSLESVSLNITGNIFCKFCSDKADIVGVMVEIFPKDRPDISLGVKNFAGLGPFTMSGVHAAKASTISIYGTLYIKNGPSLSAYVEAETPEDDGETIAANLTFPSSDKSE